MRPRWLAGVGVVLAGACARVDTKALGPVIRDSADLRIVENNVARSDPALVVDSVPALDIGADQNDPHRQFGQRDVPVRLSDGRMLVASSASEEIRVFDSAGRWLSTIGRKGGGPGEFESLGILLAGPGDTLLTYEYGNTRLSRSRRTGRSSKPCGSSIRGRPIRLARWRCWGAV